MLEFWRFLLLPNCFLFFLFFSFAIFNVKAQEEQIILTNCPSSRANFTSGSQYETNLKALLPSLASKAVPRIDTYYNTSVGTGTDRIYGYAQCMSAATADSCRACLNKSISDAGQLCPNKRRATIRYYSCIMRYSDRWFFSESDDSLAVFRTSQIIVTEPTIFNAQLSSLMQNLSNEAAFNSSRLAWGKAPYDEFSDIYGLAQCTRDLSPTACSSCLSGTISRIPSCCRNKTSGWVYFPTCNIRFRTSPFDPANRLPQPLGPPPAPPDGAATPPPLLPDSPSALSTSGTNKSRTNIIVVISSVSAAVVAVIGIILCICLSRRKKKWKKMPDADEDDMRSSESLLFDLGTLRAATNDFSLTNKVGQGGFGPVYKGTLPDGRDIAIKRLQATSSQGMAEFKNEVNLVAKLQHRNLVKLWGCCAKDQEKLLVYEYVPNSSLDRFLFADATNSARLDWSTRYKIIVGIARGLLYLHEDSRLRIIHRDLKASNILLDKDMNPKISDFGLARLFGGNETQGNTSCIVGTYGYMPPEYAMQGRYSTKSDVYSFGVLVLEIVTGRKNSGSALSEPSLDLLSYIWRHWNEGRMTDLMDQSMGEDYQRKEALRCIHLGLLCVQEDPTERPLMSTIVLMLSRYTIKLPVPSRPAYCTKSSGMSRDDNNSRGLDMPWTGSSQLTNSINVVTISELDPR